MIQKIKLLLCLTEEVYKKICVKLNFNVNSAKGNTVLFNEEKINKIELYNIDYKEYGHLWFMETVIDFPLFNCDYTAFEDELYKHYSDIFGGVIVSSLPKYDELCCSYIEYSSTVELIGDYSLTIEKLRVKCLPEQLNKALWHQYKKPHGTIEFCVDIGTDKLEILARCHGTALKKRISDTSLHKNVGLKPTAAVNQVTEKEILDWLCKKHL